MSRLCRFSVITTYLGTAMLLGGCLTGGGDADTPLTNGGAGAGGTGNIAPVISGIAPSAVVVGNEYSFTPAADDADGDSLTFSVDNLPAWASFDPATGSITGLAELGTEGLYTDIRISVSDGTASTGLPPFDIEVTQLASGSVVLSWTPPTMNTDGKPLTDLAGYKIYYGRKSGDYRNEIVVDNPGLSTYVVENLVADTYYFAASAYNASGVESMFSNEVTKTVDP